MISFLSLKSLASRKFISFLSILSIALSLSLFLMVEKLRKGVEDGFTNTISNADLIVGSRSGPLQLLLYTVFHMGSPTNNIRFSSYEEIKKNPIIDWTIPISLGDSYKGHRVVATDENFFKHYQFHGDRNVEMDKGQWASGIFDVVLGSQVAKKLNHKMGDKLVLSHGISEKAVLEHDDSPFEVTGILKPTGTPLDKSVFISLYGMEAIHVGWESGAPNYEDTTDKSKLTRDDLKVEQLTSFILKTKNRFALLHLNRFIGAFEKEPLMGIIPAVTLTELWGLLDQLEKAFLAISFFVVLIGFLSVLISLYMSLNERQREMAILRSIGVSPLKITTLLIVEATFLSIIGCLLGFALQYIFLGIVNPILEANYSVFIPMTKPSAREFVVVGLFILLGPLSGLIPALKAYKTSLHNGLLVK
ncbi:MAG: ABC transporter permease [Oligoflexia bacterium]|nr:ABC transporter permease [Oligoflexia bacterium]